MKWKKKIVHSSLLPNQISNAKKDALRSLQNSSYWIGQYEMTCRVAKEATTPLLEAFYSG
jgi:hypothetical protein